MGRNPTAWGKSWRKFIALGYAVKRAKDGGTVNPFILRAIAMSAAVIVAAWLTDIRCSGPLPAAIVGTLLALAQVIIRPSLLAASVLAIRKVSLPFIAVFFFGTNVFIFWTVGLIVPGFEVAKFSSALGGSLITGIAGFVIHTSLRTRLAVRTPLVPPTTPKAPAADGMKQAKGREIR